MYRLPPPELFQSDILTHPVASSVRFDAIVCDPPYGLRAHASTTSSRKGSRSGDLTEADGGALATLSPGPEKRRLLAGAEQLYVELFKVADAHLKPDGKLVFWIPVTNEVTEKEGECGLMERQEGIFFSRTDAALS